MMSHDMSASSPLSMLTISSSDTEATTEEDDEEELPEATTEEDDSSASAALRADVRCISSSVREGGDERCVCVRVCVGANRSIETKSIGFDSDPTQKDQKEFQLDEIVTTDAFMIQCFIHRYSKKSDSFATSDRLKKSESLRVAFRLYVI